MYATYGVAPAGHVEDVLTIGVDVVRHERRGRGQRVASRIINDLRVQEIRHRDGSFSYTIVEPDGELHEASDRFLRDQGTTGTQRTYAYVLVDHLRWLRREALPTEVVTMRDLRRYMGILGADVKEPLGAPWRVGKRPMRPSALQVAASCLKGFYTYLGVAGQISADLAAALSANTRLPTKVDRNRSLIGHSLASMPTNDLAPKKVRRRHPKMLPDGAREALMEAATTARDRMVVTWLFDGGFRIGELCGLHLADLHLRDNAACGDLRPPHAHICHRPGNANRSRAKTKYPWSIENGSVTGGLVRRVSPAMVHTYFAYMTTEYPKDASHGMLLVQQQGVSKGQPWSPDGVRAVLRGVGERAGLGRIRPHAFRHTFATSVLDASNGNLLIARDAGGWSSTVVVDEIYAHANVQDPAFVAALHKVWGVTSDQ